ncbi:MAG: aminodeoxychorismate synthase component I [Caldilineales bacterium]|nr:aminodeoxychorismate synthase component I [Caldilineales bacterium]MDW8316967.1 aminodeoxychorismate synthase component I [Anaerolineae bacterium]
MAGCRAPAADAAAPPFPDPWETAWAVVQADGRWLRFRRPVAVLAAQDLSEVLPALRQAEEMAEAQGLYAVGFISYEAAPAFDPALRVQTGSPTPLAWFGLFRPPSVLFLGNGDFGRFAAPRSGDDLSPGIPAGDPAAAFALGPWQPAMAAEAHAAAIAQIKEHIAAGDTYQVNFTFPLTASFRGEPWALFLRLAEAQRAAYAAYVDTGRFAVCSASPELFFRLQDGLVTARPMKGTARRGRTLAEDEAHAAALAASEKNRAENVMIVDMVRNDLGRIAAWGSVQVPRLFEVERYPTLWQMTSTVTARVATSRLEVLRSLFPCASITGAPKVRTMEIIRRLEPAPRGVYTGAVGFMAPGGFAQFNVAIRTVVVDRLAGRATYGVGSGIVWDSEASAEYAECLLKAQVLTAPRPTFDLLETLRWTPPEGYFLLERHLQRLADSAVYFGVPLDLAEVRHALASAVRGADEPLRVRLLVDLRGCPRVETAPLPSTGLEPVRLGLARQPVDPEDVFLYHKTTRRGVYEAARRSRPDCDDVLLWNPRREVTESTVANVAVRLNGQLVTPPVSSGLLAGTLRAELLACGRLIERVINLDDLGRCQGVYLFNSVRGWRRAVIREG